MKPTIEQITEVIYVTMPLCRRDVVVECASKINALYESSMPDDNEISSEANSFAMGVSYIDTTFEDGFYTGAKWALNRYK